MKNKSELKTVTKGVRLTGDMKKLFSMIASEQGITIGKYLRDAGLILAEMSIDEKELMELIKEKDQLKAQKTFHHLIKESKDTMVNSVGEFHSQLAKRIDRLEKLLEIFLYVYLFHTPEVKSSQKIQAKKSAISRKKKILTLIEKNSQTL